MNLNNKVNINPLNIAQIFFLLFLASLFFPIRYVFPNQQAFQTGAYSDFTSISLYLSDILLILSFIFIIVSRGRNIFKNDNIIVKPACVLTFWLIITPLAHIKTLSTLNLWFFVKYLELIVAYGTSLYLFSKTDIKALFIKSFVVLASFEALLALWQFKVQHSIGGLLHKLGEQVITPQMQGIAKIVSGGTAYIRGYGTFPHPNLLSTFLAAGALFSLYLFLKENSLKAKTFWGLAIFLNILGVTVTFSRAAYLGLGVALIIFFGQSIIRGLWSRQASTKIAFTVVALSGLISLGMFHQFLSTRATVTDSASLERIFYAKIGLKMIEQHPIFGVGIGESVLHMQQYSPIKLWPWQIQPVHNYFLLAAAEIGIPGALILLWFFFNHLFKLIKKLRSTSQPTYYLLLTCLLLTFLVLMQFDHYFYTLEQTQMLLWVVLGIISAEIKKSPEGDFPTS